MVRSRRYLDFYNTGNKCIKKKKPKLASQTVLQQWDTYIAFKALVAVSFLGEAVVLVGALSAPGLAGHSQDGDGGFAPVRFTIANLTV